MNATSFLANISKNLQSLEIQTKLISTIATTSDESKIILEGIQKSISDIIALIQQQQNFFKQHNEMVEQRVNQLKLNQDDILNKINEVLFKMESYSISQNCTSAKSKQKKTINNLSGTSSESDDANNNKINPYDSAPTLVALIRAKIKENEQNDEDSDGLIEEAFMFDYSKHFTHKANRKILKEYVTFFMSDYESRGENFKKGETWSPELIRQICNTYFGTRRIASKSTTAKSKARNINNRRNNRTLKKFNARKDVISALDTEVLRHPIKEVRVLFSRDLMSPEISEDEEAQNHNSVETYFVPSIPWRSDEAIQIRNIIDAEVEHQRHLKLCKGSAGGMINSYKRVPVTPSNEPIFSRLVPFIPKCPTSSNFPQWAIKSTSQDSSGENIDSQAIAVNTAEIFENNLMKSFEDINFDQFFTLDENNQITTDLQHILNSPYEKSYTTHVGFNNNKQPIIDFNSGSKDDTNILKEMDINNNQQFYLNDQTEQIVEQASQMGKSQMKLKEKKKQIEQMKQGNQDKPEESLKPPSKRRKNNAPVSTTRVTRSNAKVTR